MREMFRDHQSAPADVRVSVYERDGYTCQDCGVQGRPGIRVGDIQAHHLVGWSRGGEHTADNLVTLCTLCHKARERTMRGQAIREQYVRAVEAGQQTPSAAWLRKHPHVIPGSQQKKLPKSWT